MNFFGHATIASWRRRDPGYVLGSMLPDFATMLGTRPPEVCRDDLRAGVRFHHETDRVFHDSTTFRQLERSARHQLRRRGLPRGSSLAVAHVGVELMIDAELSCNDDARSCYLNALTRTRSDEIAAGIRWPHPGLAKRFDELCTLLAERGTEPVPVVPALFARRLARALSGRRRLALDERGERIVSGWVAAAHGEVARELPALLEELALALDPALRPPHVRQ